MHNNGLEHELPTSLGSLTKLTTLQLDGNKFVGTVPKELGRLQSLGTCKEVCISAGTDRNCDLMRLHIATHLCFSTESLRLLDNR